MNRNNEKKYFIKEVFVHWLAFTYITSPSLQQYKSRNQFLTLNILMFIISFCFFKEPHIKTPGILSQINFFDKKETRTLNIL